MCRRGQAWFPQREEIQILWSLGSEWRVERVQILKAFPRGEGTRLVALQGREGEKLSRKLKGKAWGPECWGLNTHASEKLQHDSRISHRSVEDRLLQHCCRVRNKLV